MDSPENYFPEYLGNVNTEPNEEAIAIIFAGMEAPYLAPNSLGFPGAPTEQRVQEIMDDLLEADPFMGPLANYNPNRKNGPLHLHWIR